MKFKLWAVSFLSIFALAALISRPLQAEEPAPGGKFIRVAVLKDVPEVALALRGSYEIIDGESGKTIFSGRKDFQARAAAKDGIFFDGQEYPTGHLRLKTNKDISVWIKGVEKRYRRLIDLRKGKNGKLLVINTVDLETYIKGILFHETSRRWPMEAFKAQAVASRTYALYRLQRSMTLPYDVTSDIYSQVYGGKSAERYRTNIAVDKTKGQVMLFEGEVLPAYFHSSCGGRTEDVSELWKQDIPAPMGRICDTCKGLPHSNWKKNFRSKDVEEKLAAAGIKTGAIKEINALERNQSGRIRKLEIISREGKVTHISGKGFRGILGPNIVRSNKYAIEMKGYYFDLAGQGWGHGVGMCQWGAYGMARQHFTYDEILEFYYPGSEIVDDRAAALKPRSGAGTIAAP